MELIKIITQKEISEILDNSVGQAGNKIKLRSVSHQNLIRHLKNIPYKAINEPQIESSNINSNEDKTWNLTSNNNTDYIDGARKPINVKESMIENIIRHSEMNGIKNETQTPIINNETEVKLEQEPVIPSNPSSINIDMSDLNFDRLREETDNIRQQVKSKEEAIDREGQEANESDKAAQEVSVRYTEAQKRNQEAKLKNQEAKIKYAETIKAQNEILKSIEQKYDNLLSEIKERKEKNLNIVAEMQPRISSIEDETTNLNNDTAKWIELANATSFDSVLDFPYIEEEEQVVKRVA